MNIELNYNRWLNSPKVKASDKEILKNIGIDIN